MKHVFCILNSQILREPSRLRGYRGGRGGRFSGFVDAEEISAEMERGKDHWAVWLGAEHIEESAWRGLAEWVGQESHRGAPHALSDLLEADLPLSLTTEQLIEVRQDLARLEAESLNNQARAAFDKLILFLDGAIRHGKDCEGDPRRRSSTQFIWRGKD